MGRAFRLTKDDCPGWASSPHSRKTGAIIGHGKTRGFTLIELMVALAVLAVVAATVYTRGGESIRQLTTIEERIIARMIAENEIAEFRLERNARTEPQPASTQRRRIEFAGRNWEVVRDVSATNHTLLQRMEISVYHAPRELGEDPIDLLVTYVGLH